MRRFAALVAAEPALAEAAIVTAARPEGARALARARIRAATGIAVQGTTLDALALDLLRAHPLETGLALDLELIDPLDARGDLRARRRAAVLGRVERLAGRRRRPRDRRPAHARPLRRRRAAPDPQAARRRHRRRGVPAAARCAARRRSTPTRRTSRSPALLAATKDEHRGSLAADPVELDRQRRREIDLAKILARLYRAYVDELVRHGCLTGGDALAEATRLLEQQPGDRARAIAPRLRVRVRRRRARPAGRRRCASCTRSSATRSTASRSPAIADAATQRSPARGPSASSAAPRRPCSSRPARCRRRSLAAMRVVHGDPALAIPRGDALRVLRAPSRAEEAVAVAERVAALVARGHAARRGSRSCTARCARSRLRGRADRARRPRRARTATRRCSSAPTCCDALALLWTAVDPYHHVWLLRALQTPMLALSRRIARGAVRRAGRPAAGALRAAGRRYRPATAAGTASATCGWDERAARRARRRPERRTRASASPRSAPGARAGRTGCATPASTAPRTRSSRTAACCCRAPARRPRARAAARP